MKPTFLIDTNIIIQLEDAGAGQIQPAFSSLHALFIKHSLNFFYHPSSERDFENDQNEARKIESLSRLRKYPQLISPPIPDRNELEVLFGGISKSNDVIDCQILYALKRSCVTYLVSEDIGIRKRARYSGLEERVLNCKEAINLIEKAYEEKIISNPRVEEEYCYRLNLEEDFFNSLRLDYPAFNNWFLEKCCQTQRKSWCIKEDDKIAALCIYKDEALGTLPTPGMKLSTFKVSEDYEGRKYGELLLRMTFLHAVNNKIKTVWVTTYSKQEKLIYMLKNFGFKVFPELMQEQIVLYKEMQPPKSLLPMEPLDFHITYFPYFKDGTDVEKFLIPIQPSFFKILFPESTIDPQPIFEGVLSHPMVPGNTIRKVYLSHSRKKEITKGSLIFFYVSAPFSSLATLGIVEKTERIDSEESLSSAIGKRSVYTVAQIKNMSEKEVFVISFRIVRHLVPISLADMKAAKILTAAPQSISIVEQDKYNKLKKIIEFDD